MLHDNSATASMVQAHERKRVASAAVAEATLTPAFLVKVENLLASVQYIRTACGLLGVSRRTFYHWKREGAALRDLKPLDELTPRERVLVDFCNAVERGIAKGELNDLNIITRAAQSNWRAAAWRLERRAPARWGARRLSRPRNGEPIGPIVAELLRTLGCNRPADDASNADDAGAHAEVPVTEAEPVAAATPVPVNEAVPVAVAASAVARSLFARQESSPARTGLDALVNDLRDSAALSGLAAPRQERRGAKRGR